MASRRWCSNGRARLGGPALRLLGVEMRMARGTPSYEPRLGALYVVFNAGEAQSSARNHAWDTLDMCI